MIIPIFSSSTLTEACAARRLSAAPGYAYNGMAWAAEQGHLAALGLHHSSTPCIDVYRSGRGSLELHARLMRSPASLLSSVTILPNSSEFATGEAINHFSSRMASLRMASISNAASCGLYKSGRMLPYISSLLAFTACHAVWLTKRNSETRVWSLEM